MPLGLRPRPEGVAFTAGGEGQLDVDRQPFKGTAASASAGLCPGAVRGGMGGSGSSTRPSASGEAHVCRTSPRNEAISFASLDAAAAGVLTAAFACCSGGGSSVRSVEAGRRDLLKN